MLMLSLAPLGRGFLTGKIQSAEDLNSSMLKAYPRFQGEAMASNMKLVREVEKLAAEKGCTPGQIAINWILAISKRPDMPTIIPIPGSKHASRVKENSREFELTQEEMAEIDRILDEFPIEGNRYPDFLSGVLNG
jgi:pyridoxine 4-dehydrogenase